MIDKYPLRSGLVDEVLRLFGDENASAVCKDKKIDVFRVFDPGRLPERTCEKNLFTFIFDLIGNDLAALGHFSVHICLPEKTREHHNALRDNRENIERVENDVSEFPDGDLEFPDVDYVARGDYIDPFLWGAPSDKRFFRRFRAVDGNVFINLEEVGDAVYVIEVTVSDKNRIKAREAFDRGRLNAIVHSDEGVKNDFCFAVVNSDRCCSIPCYFHFYISFYHIITLKSKIKIDKMLNFKSAKKKRPRTLFFGSEVFLILTLRLLI